MYFVEPKLIHIKTLNGRKTTRAPHNLYKLSSTNTSKLNFEKGDLVLVTNSYIDSKGLGEGTTGVVDFFDSKFVYFHTIDGVKSKRGFHNFKKFLPTMSQIPELLSLELQKTIDHACYQLKHNWTGQIFFPACPTFSCHPGVVLVIVKKR